MGRPKRSMHEKFNKKIDKDAKEWLEVNGFTPPNYDDARKIQNLPKFVHSYFRRHKVKTQQNEEEQEPNA